MNKSKSNGTKNHSQPTSQTLASIPPALKTLVAQQIQALGSSFTKSARDTVAMGQTLEFVRSQLGRAHFQAWLRNEFPSSRSVASNCMRAARYFGEVECLDQFQPGALYLLARKDVSPAARTRAINCAKAGERISKSRAQEIVANQSGEPTMCPWRAADSLQGYLGDFINRLSDHELQSLIGALRCGFVRLRQVARQRQNTSTSSAGRHDRGR